MSHGRTVSCCAEAPFRRALPAAIALAGAVGLAVPAHSVEGGIGAYLLGSRDSPAGIAPPPGAYFTTDFIHIDGSVSFLALGGAALTDVTSSAWIAKVNYTHSPAVSAAANRRSP